MPDPTTGSGNARTVARTAEPAAALTAEPAAALTLDPIGSLLGLLLDEPEDELSRLLLELRWLALKHPIAARAACRALRAEGERYAATPEGRAWRRRLAGSELVRRGQLVWEVGTSNALDGNGDGGDDDVVVLPSELVDAFARAAARRDLESAIARRTEPRPEQGS